MIFINDENIETTKLSCIYIITSPSFHYYIGRTVDLNKRMCNYRAYKAKAQVKLSCSFKKYGIENHIISILRICRREELNLWESFYIKLFDSFDTEYGLNLTTGGDCPTRSKETIEKIRLANLGKKMSAESSIKKRNSMYGKNKEPRSKAQKEYLQKLRLGSKARPETKEKMRAGQLKAWEKRKQTEEYKNAPPKIPWNKGMKMSDDFREMRRRLTLGKKQSTETKEKRSRAMLGKTGKPKSEEEKKIIKETLIELWKTEEYRDMMMASRKK